MKVLKYDFKRIKRFLGFSLFLVFLLYGSTLFFPFEDTTELGWRISVDGGTNSIFLFTLVYFGFHLYSSYFSKEAIFIHLVPMSGKKLFVVKLGEFFIWGILFLFIKISLLPIRKTLDLQMLEWVGIYLLQILWLLVFILNLGLSMLMANNNPEHQATIETILLFILFMIGTGFLTRILSIGLDSFFDLRIAKEISMNGKVNFLFLPKKTSLLSLCVTDAILYLLLSIKLKRESFY
ncbi:MAG: hypothetical protein Q4Q07_01510 [Tissierellia bacterium]|nr:hypothetical protein [Tissierellia bacterium]